MAPRGAKTRPPRPSRDMSNEQNLTNRGEDAKVEAALIQRVLDLHPTRVTAAELIRDLAGEDADFGARDAIERALRELTGAGLLHRTDDGLVTPTRAAVHLAELLDA
jgi:hypothetical protein